MNKEQLNKLVSRYQETKDETVFNEIYAHISSEWRTLETIGKSIRADIHEITALYEDTLLKCINRYNGEGNFENYFKNSIVKERAYFYRTRNNRNKREVFYEKDSDDESANFEIKSDFNLEEVALSKKEADQRELIDFLVRGENERATAIVQTYLTTELESPTAIGKHLGLDHKQVSRALEKLSRKFKQQMFGNYEDYLIAL